MPATKSMLATSYAVIFRGGVTVARGREETPAAVREFARVARKLSIVERIGRRVAAAVGSAERACWGESAVVRSDDGEESADALRKQPTARIGEATHGASLCAARAARRLKASSARLIVDAGEIDDSVLCGKLMGAGGPLSMMDREILLSATMRGGFTRRARGESPRRFP